MPQKRCDKNCLECKLPKCVHDIDDEAFAKLKSNENEPKESKWKKSNHTYYMKNIEKLRAKKRQYYADNRQKLIEYQKEYYRAHKEEISKKLKEKYRELHSK